MSFGYVSANPPKYYPAPKRARRRRSGRGQFFTGVLLGYLGTALIGLVVVLCFNLIFPPTRLNVLLLGLDRRPGESAVARTDTLIVATVDPLSNYVGLLSIPRDLWVTLPDGSENRINTAHFFAENNQRGAGPQAAIDTVSSNFGIGLSRYARIDFAGFVQIIDSVGGVTLDVKSPIVDYEYPTYDYGTQVIQFDPGLQHMDGERALQYARTRHSSSDFDRAKRQQAVLAAFIGRLLEPDAWPRFPLLLVALQTAVDTNLTPVDVVRVIPTLVLVGPQNIDRRVIEGNMVQPFTTSVGASVQLPVWDRINPVLFEMFGE
jgi:polyisoprenyl-teichoic acid--peptidoglycan teichoic acid transferase